MTGILEMFRDLSEPDEFHQQAQLELFAWARKQAQRNQDAKRRWLRCPERTRKLAEYRRRHHEQRKQDPEWRAKQRERNRQWMAAKRTEQRAA